MEEKRISSRKTRVAYVIKDGKKARTCKKCGAEL